MQESAKLVPRIGIVKITWQIREKLHPLKAKFLTERTLYFFWPNERIKPMKWSDIDNTTYKHRIP